MQEKGFFHNFLKENQGKLKHYIFSRIEDQDEADEIFQQALIAAFESWPRFLHQSAGFTWLVGIARHEIADYYRKKRIKIFLFSRLPWLENLASQALGPEQEMLKEEMRIRVRRVMSQLREDYRIVLNLKYEQGLSVLEIAKKLNENIKTIESRLFRARTAFAKIFAADRD